MAQKGWHKLWRKKSLDGRLLAHESGLIVRIVSQDGAHHCHAENVDAWSKEFQPSMPAGMRIDLLRMLINQARSMFDYLEKRKGRKNDQ